MEKFLEKMKGEECNEKYIKSFHCLMESDCSYRKFIATESIQRNCYHHRDEKFENNESR